MGNYDFELDLNSKNTMSIINSWINNDSFVLEFGPANGRLTKHLTLKKSCHVTIVELDQKAGEEAAYYAEKAYIGPKEGNIENLYWIHNPQKYDYIIFADVLEHLTDPQRILALCKDMLAENGEILISIPNLAHNSVLIDLYNDKFFYDNTGLLDKTHVHFFTYHSFQEMSKETGLYIIKQEPVYSCVGWNEISNSYNDVPFSIERELRLRRSGSIYQYVFCLSTNRPIDLKGYDDLPLFKQETSRQQEISCYFWQDSEMQYQRKGYIYESNKRNTCQFPINSVVARLRIDPLETSGLLRIYRIAFKTAKGVTEEAFVSSHNATICIGNLYFFEDLDPWLELSVEKYVETPLEYVEVEFEIMDQKMSRAQAQIYEQLFCIATSSPETISNTENLKAELEKAREFIELKEKELSEEIQYIHHLEKDIETLKTDLKKTREEQTQYIAHLEKDITILKERLCAMEE